ncbi:MAG TPA: rhodanese-like domain-containing protein [bacterium]|nr:rhodanese-like domain-containing protein [bacterium]
MTMTKEAVKDKMKDGNVVVLNVLPEAEFAKLHIIGSENIPFGLTPADFIQAVEKKYGKEKFFITYSASLSSDTGLKAAKTLQENKFKANDYAGGTQEWSEAGYPTEGTDAKASVASAK